ncbi:MAG: undecaprenyl-diphosphate phosphatase [Candidatus Bipolaricaulis sp.]|nr:undecaprenyl-diphosphate phosphatase [Candidatus Bipolaricaulis sp.]
MIQYLLLGIVQGVTEFLPVSSSGHLALVEWLLGFDPPGVLLETCLHLGTVAAVIVVFRSDIADLFRALTHRGTLERRKEIGFLIVATIPIVVVGFLARGRIDEAFASLRLMGIGWLVVGLLLLFVDRAARRSRKRLPAFVDAVVIGAAQAASLLPGFSRSGLTISAGVLRGIDSGKAVRFSFLLSIPALVGAAVLNLAEMGASGGLGHVEWYGVLLGAGAAFLIGLGAARVLLSVVARGQFWVFGIYSILVGAAAVVWGGA